MRCSTDKHRVFAGNVQKCAKYKCCAGRFRFVSFLFYFFLPKWNPTLSSSPLSFFCTIWVAEQFSYFFLFTPHFDLKNISTGAKPILIRQFLIIILSIYQLWIVHYPFQINREFNTKISKQKKHLLHHDTFHDASHKTFDTWFAQCKSEWQKTQSVNPHNDFTTLFQRISWSIHSWQTWIKTSIGETSVVPFFRLWFYGFWHLSLNGLNGMFVVLRNLSNFVIIIMIVKFYIFPFCIVILLIKQINIKFLIIIAELTQLLMSMKTDCTPIELNVFTSVFNIFPINPMF